MNHNILEDFFSLYFCKYSKEFCISKHAIPSLENDVVLYNDAKSKTKILSDHFKSVWLSRDNNLMCSDLPEIFGKCKDCEYQIVHICKHDNDSEAIVEFRNSIMSVNLHNNEINIKGTKSCQLEWIFHCEEDLIDAIDEISNGVACGPDGWSLALIKGMKHIIANFFYIIYCTSMKEGHFPSNLKNGYVAGVYKSGPKSNSCQL